MRRCRGKRCGAQSESHAYFKIDASSCPSPRMQTAASPVNSRTASSQGGQAAAWPPCATLHRSAFCEPYLAQYAPAEEHDASHETESEGGTQRQHHPADGDRLRCLPVQWRDHWRSQALRRTTERVEKRGWLGPRQR